jgi:aminomethyltransferase
MRQTPLFDIHQRTALNVINLKGVARPVEYVGHAAEHRAIREAVSICDASHLGDIEIEGPDATALVQKLITNDVETLAVGRSLYTVICNDQGHIIDDLVCYRRGEDKYLWIVNVPRTDQDLQWVRQHAHGLDVAVRNLTLDLALIAVQGPYSSEVLQRITATDLSVMPYFGCAETVVITDQIEVPCMVARTGYTGERGYEICVERELAPAVWTQLLLVGAPLGIVPHGVAARESTRTECGYLLNGNDMDDTTYPAEVNLNWLVRMNTDFIGKEALINFLPYDVQRKFVGLAMDSERTMRFGHPILKDGRIVGQVTSGPLPARVTGGDASLGLGFVATELSEPGNTVKIDIAGTAESARIVSLPHYELRVKDEGKADTRSPYELEYSADHVWARPVGDGTIALGLTDYGQRHLGDVLSVELPAAGERINKGEAFSRLDAYHKVFDLVAPISGEIVSVNGDVARRPADINKYPYLADGLVIVKADDAADIDNLLDLAAYQARVRDLLRYETWSTAKRTT